MDLQLSGKVAIVTGSSRGIGLAIARSLAHEGCRICVCARTTSRLDETARELGAVTGRTGDVLAVTADLSTPDGVQRVIDETAGRFGGIDILINNIGLGRGGALLETTDAEWTEAIDQTLMPAVRASRLAVPHNDPTPPRSSRLEAPGALTRHCLRPRWRARASRPCAATRRAGSARDGRPRGR